MEQQRLVISLLGSGGGVSKALLSLLDRSAGDPDNPLYAPLNDCRIHCIDREQRPKAYYRELCPRLIGSISVHSFDADNAERLRQHLDRTSTGLVVDLSWADSASVIAVCDELGIAYVNTALENPAVDEATDLFGFTLIERFERFEAVRGNYSRVKAIVGSGMNPGVVQWMALSVLRAHPEERPIGCYIVETDDSFYTERALKEEGTVYSTWSPECFLDEALLNYPMMVKDGTPLFLYQNVYDSPFRVKLGDRVFYGCLMPHEESLTLSRLLGVESGFIYEVNDVTTSILRAHLDDSDPLWDWEHKVLDPADAPLSGGDLVGVLLVYPDKERYMYNLMRTDEIYPAYRTNATYLQVAIGVYAGICTVLFDSIDAGVHWVDELLLRHPDCRYGGYVSYLMTPFVSGENDSSDGLLLERMADWPEEEEDSHGG